MQAQLAQEKETRSFFLCLRRPGSPVACVCAYACACVVRVNQPKPSFCCLMFQPGSELERVPSLGVCSESDVPPQVRTGAGGLAASLMSHHSWKFLACGRLERVARRLGGEDWGRKIWASTYGTGVGVGGTWADWLQWAPVARIAGGSGRFRKHNATSNCHHWPRRMADAVWMRKTTSLTFTSKALEYASWTSSGDFLIERKSRPAQKVHSPNLLMRNVEYISSENL